MPEQVISELIMFDNIQCDTMKLGKCFSVFLVQTNYILFN